ncbi:MAG: cache domain-containing protein, partial [Bacillota bacterium]
MKGKLSTKIVSGIGIGIVAGLLALSLIVNYYISTMINTMEKDYNQLLFETVNAQMDSQLDSAKMSVLSLANNVRVQELFANRDREQLMVELLPVYDVLKEDVAQIQFHLPDSTAFLRLHMPDSYGDSLRDFRFTVNEANAKRQIVEGLEEGRAGYGFRVVVPMFYQGIHTGSVEYGSDFGLAFLNNLKNRYDSDYFIYTWGGESVAWVEDGGNEGGFVAATVATDEWSVEGAHAEEIKAGKMVSLLSPDKKKSVLIIPYYDYQGNVGGYVKSVIDRSAVLGYTIQVQKVLFALSVIIAFLLLIAIYLYIRFEVVKPLTQLQNTIKEVESGKLGVEFKYKSNKDNKDEIGLLGASFNKMVETLKEVIEDVKDASHQVANSAQSLAETSHHNTAAAEEV